MRKFPDQFPHPMENDEDLEIFERPIPLTDEEGEVLAEVMPYPEPAADIAERLGREKEDILPLLDGLIQKLWVLRVGSREDGKYLAHTTTFEFYMPYLDNDLADFRWKMIDNSMDHTPPEKPREIGIGDDEILPVFRIVPYENSTPEGHEVLSADRVDWLIDQADDDELAVAECLCRKEKDLIGDPCQKNAPIEQCLFFDPFSTAAVEAGVARKITKAEAHELMRRAEEYGLAHQAYNSEHPKTICSCCDCCCPSMVFVGMGIEGVSTRSNYYSHIDPDKCKGSQECVGACNFEAISFDEEKKIAVVDMSKCYGCGVCVQRCPSNAPSLIVKKKIMPLPKTDEERLEIRARQKGKTELYEPKWEKEGILKGR